MMAPEYLDVLPIDAKIIRVDQP